MPRAHKNFIDLSISSDLITPFIINSRPADVASGCIVHFSIQKEGGRFWRTTPGFLWDQQVKDYSSRDQLFHSGISPGETTLQNFWTCHVFIIFVENITPFLCLNIFQHVPEYSRMLGNIRKSDFSGIFPSTFEESGLKSLKTGQI